MSECECEGVKRLMNSICDTHKPGSEFGEVGVMVCGQCSRAALAAAQARIEELEAAIARIQNAGTNYKPALSPPERKEKE